MVKKVKIASCIYKVIEQVISNDENHVGVIYPHKLEIYIEKRLPQARKIQTLIHEIVHGILFEYGDIKLSEQKVDAIASGIAQVLKDNPKLKRLL